MASQACPNAVRQHEDTTRIRETSPANVRCVAATSHTHKKKSPAFRQGLPYSCFTVGLAVHIGVLAGLLALAARILLLLAGLLTAALLLAGLLTRVLVLLARIILIGH